jgi:mannose-6-phosphate isomerase
MKTAHGSGQKTSSAIKEGSQRPWGYYDVLADNPDHKVKRIVVFPQKRLSLQRHRRRSEHWYIVSGDAIVTLNGREVPLAAGDAIDIPKGATHRIENIQTDSEVVFIEIQRGDYFGEDDIERLEDDYGRT